MLAKGSHGFGGGVFPFLVAGTTFRFSDVVILRHNSVLLEGKYVCAAIERLKFRLPSYRNQSSEHPMLRHTGSIPALL